MHGRPLRGVATPVATAPPRTMLRVQACVATDSEDVLHLRVGEGRDRNGEKRSVRELVSESTHGRDGSSGRIEEQRCESTTSMTGNRISRRASCSRIMMGAWGRPSVHGNEWIDSRTSPK